jgi:DNA-binding HxlR family transcriptional regulator
MNANTEEHRVDAAEAEHVCPHYHYAVELIGRRWTGAIVAALTEGPLRFAQMSAAVPRMSDRLLSQRLKELEREGLVERSVEAGAPVRVTYSLTAKGVALKPAISALRSWGQRWHQAG